MYALTGGWAEGLTERWTDECNTLTDRWTDECIGRPMDWWKDEQMK